jgi:Spy/CpxP family protein refolding chaperone
MKAKLITAVAVVALGATMAVAAPREGGFRRGARAERFTQKLNLTDAQRQQIREMHQSFRSENRALFQTFRESMRELHDARRSGDTAKADALKSTLDAQRVQLKQLRDGFEQRVGTLLTPDQLTQWNAMKAERAAHRAHHEQNRDR